jgi:MarR family transcriptional regulator, transcriptional regulator for hemolysin
VTKDGIPTRSPALAEAASPEDAPGVLINHAAKVFNRRLDMLLRPLGLPMAHLTPLMQLHHHPTMLQRDLVKACGIGQPAMVHALAKLEEAGLISRAQNEHDRRAATISLTSAGQELVYSAWPLLIDANVHALSGFTPEESQTFSKLLKRMIATLGSPLTP